MKSRFDYVGVLEEVYSSRLVLFVRWFVTVSFDEDFLSFDGYSKILKQIGLSTFCTISLLFLNGYYFK